jgi:Tfp pilus assembly protein PilF
MNDTAGSGEGPGGRWLPWVFFAVLVLPFDPHWFDFEQVRRGILLALTGLVLLRWPLLPPVRGERIAVWFVLGMAVATLVRGVGDRFFGGEQPSFSTFDAIFRLAHWLALGVVLRLGAVHRTSAATPLAAMLLLTSLFGLLQRLGLAELAGYGVEREPVSVFGNLNVAAEWTAVATAAVAALLPHAVGRLARRLAFAALVAAGAYAVVNQSRSVLVALPAGLLLLWLLRRRAAGHVPLLLVLAGALVGAACHVTAPSGDATPTLPGATAPRNRSTIEVRLEIAKGATALFLGSPVFGVGAGQFAIQYGRVRTPREIELSSHGRQFATEVRTAHDDWLELLVDGGLPALVLFAAALFALQRGRRENGERHRGDLVPLFVLLLLMFVRAPLLNAPAVVAALWTVGTAAPRTVPPAAWRPWAARLLGLVLVALGVVLLVGNQLAAPYQAARARSETPPLASLAHAAAWMPFEPRWQQLLAQESLRGGDLARARRHAAAAVALRPFDPQGYALLAEILIQDRAPGHAAQLVEHALRLDPVHPELRLWRSWLCLHEGRIDDAIRAVVLDPHPLLRAQLYTHFRAMAQTAEQRGDARTAARLQAESHFVRLTELLGDTGEQALIDAGAHVHDFLAELKDASTIHQDLRPLVVSALHALDLGKRDMAVELGRNAAATNNVLASWHKDLLGTHLDALAELPSWRGPLERR